ncbi:MAG: ribonuclease Z [Candidatus Aenigmarchaeota archaeon]|nr:ribonuclease Z [Candidatus Aenigmarchaeota archaeon]
MKVIFLGVGEAFDENHPNTSILIESETKLLLDCGYSAAAQLWKYNPDPEFLDAVYITHQHADHYFGLPQIVNRMREDGRKKKLSIICNKKLVEIIKELFDYAYKGLLSRPGMFPVEFLGVEPGKNEQINELEILFEKTGHHIENLAVRISDGKHILCYTGDGKLTNENLCKNADILINEGYFFEQGQKHLYIPDVIKMAEDNNVKCLALVHINRDVRKKEMNRILGIAKESKIKVIVPEAMEEYKI